MLQVETQPISVCIIEIVVYSAYYYVLAKAMRRYLYGVTKN